MSPARVPSKAQLQAPEIKERRQHQRYPITALAEYILDGTRASASTLDISSGGVLLKTGTSLPLNRSIQVSIDWPAPLTGQCHLRLVVLGRVIRSDKIGTVVEIIRHEFHLSSRSTPAYLPSGDAAATSARRQ